MSYGSPSWRPWVLDEAAARPFFRRALEAGINFFDTADMYSAGVERGSDRPGAAGARRRARRSSSRPRSSSRSRDGPNLGGLSRKHIVQGARPASGASGSIQSISIRSTGSTRHVRSRRRWPRWITWSSGQGALHRRELGICLADGAGARSLRAARLGAVRVDAEPLQPALSRGRAGDDAALPRTRAWA